MDWLKICFSRVYATEAPVAAYTVQQSQMNVSLQVWPCQVGFLSSRRNSNHRHSIVKVNEWGKKQKTNQTILWEECIGGFWEGGATLCATLAENILLWKTYFWHTLAHGLPHCAGVYPELIKIPCQDVCSLIWAMKLKIQSLFQPVFKKKKKEEERKKNLSEMIWKIF